MMIRPACPAFFRTWPLLLFFSLSLALSGMARAEAHRATFLGNPATRFADPLKTPEDLRRTLLKDSLREDVGKVLRMSDYLGDIEDFRHAAANASIAELSIPAGTVLPAMSTRKQGKPVLLRGVLWAGKKPIDAYTFSFISLDRRYRVIAPKACANFWIEEQLPRPAPALALTCEAPAESALLKNTMVCHTLTNTGDLPETLARLSMPIPANSKLNSVTREATIGDNEIAWTFPNFAPGDKQTLCATFSPSQAGTLPFAGSAAGQRAASVDAHCETRAYGIPAVLLEVVDLADPVLVGKDVVYVIRVLNQGSQALTNVKIVAGLEDSQRFQSGAGATEVKAEGDLITPALVPLLNPGEQVEWRIVVKAEKAGDVRFNVGLHADQFGRVISETESTFQY
ncbi:MAG: hypothetical protein B7Y41_14570 [Hydrogenophilales bacterium 28-61-23]|nr:MAG: hypothetical protein B7Y41_14570 [Hydrogenophilales bacterium 28-61-23]